MQDGPELGHGLGQPEGLGLQCDDGGPPVDPQYEVMRHPQPLRRGRRVDHVCEGEPGGGPGARFHAAP